jgi:hypothetical protein
MQIFGDKKYKFLQKTALPTKFELDFFALALVFCKDNRKRSICYDLNVHSGSFQLFKKFEKKNRSDLGSNQRSFDFLVSFQKILLHK